MFSYLHAIVSPTGVYAAADDFGAQHGAVGLAQRIDKAATDFARLLQSCGLRTRRDVFAEDLTHIERLLAVSRPRDDADTVGTDARGLFDPARRLASPKSPVISDSRCAKHWNTWSSIVSPLWSMVLHA